jgi:hypothetical protein
MGSWGVIFKINAGPNLLEGTIGDISACRICNAQKIVILAGDVKRST